MKLNKLKGKIAEKGLKKSDISKCFGITIQALNKKLSGKTKITVEDANKFCKILNLTDANEIYDIFF